MTTGREHRSALSHEMERASIELHDSEVERLEHRPGVLAVHFSHAYIHRSAGEPGRDAGTGWSQRAVFLVANPAVSGEVHSLPAVIMDGELLAGGASYVNCIPIPFRSEGAVKLSLAFTTGRRLTVAGSSAAFELRGEPVFIERFPWDGIGALPPARRRLRPVLLLWALFLLLLIASMHVVAGRMISLVELSNGLGGALLAPALLSMPIAWVLGTISRAFSLGQTLVPLLAVATIAVTIGFWGALGWLSWRARESRAFLYVLAGLLTSSAIVLPFAAAWVAAF